MANCIHAELAVSHAESGTVCRAELFLPQQHILGREAPNLFSSVSTIS